jgi:hypothetical protein
MERLDHLQKKEEKVGAIWCGVLRRFSLIYSSPPIPTGRDGYVGLKNPANFFFKLNLIHTMGSVLINNTYGIFASLLPMSGRGGIIQAHISNPIKGEASNVP